MKERICAALCALLLLTGCAGEPGAGTPAGTGSPSKQPPTSAGSVAEDTAGTAAPESDGVQSETPVIPDGVENSGGYFVRVDEKVYFRLYGPEALPDTALFGQFLSAETAPERESQVVSYDLTTGELDTLWTDTGRGPLWYGDHGFYTQERLNGADVVTWHSADGGAWEAVAPGELLGVTDEGLTAVVQRDTAGATDRTFFLFRGAGQANSFPTQDSYEFAGLSDDGLFLFRLDYTEGGRSSLWQMPAEAEAPLLWLGDLPPTETPYFNALTTERFLTGGGKIALSAGYYVGTGNMLDATLYMTAVPGVEGSLEFLDPAPDGGGIPAPIAEEETEEEGFLRIALDEDGTASLVSALEGDLRVAWQEGREGDVERFNGTAWETILEGAQEFLWDESGYARVVQTVEAVNGGVWLMTASCETSLADSVGWRTAFALMEMSYLRVDGAEVTELASVETGRQFAGWAWFDAEGSSMLWQELFDDSDAEVSTAYRLPISPDAVWDGGRTPYLEQAQYDLDALEDYGSIGYSIPDAEGVLLWFRLNAAGEVVSLTEKPPEALLSIVMYGDASDGDAGTPPLEETFRDGAAEVLELERRSSDEDTPWYWTQLEALEDGVTVRVERTPNSESFLEDLFILNGGYIPGSMELERTLNRGEYVIIRASLPWHAELRVSASKNGNWGYYVFGEDNYLHLHDGELEQGDNVEWTLAAYPPADTGTQEQLWTALQGSWAYCVADGSACTALVEFGDAGNLIVETADESVWTLGAEPGWLYSSEWETPDLLSLSVDGEYTEEQLGLSGPVGDYRLELFRTDGLELLRLVQVNNGDGILSTLFPDSERLTAFTLRRWTGAGQPGAKLRDMTANMTAVRYDRDANLLWLQAAEAIDVREDGSPVYRSAPGAACLPYTLAAWDAAQPLWNTDDTTVPMRVYEVAIDAAGQVARIGPAASP